MQKRKIVEFGVALLAAGALGWVAQEAWMHLAGPALSRQNLVYSFSTAVPAWAEWDFGGARHPDLRWSAVVLAGLAGLWAPVVNYGGRMPRGSMRMPWLFAALAGSAAFAGAGASEAAWAMAFGVIVAWCFERGRIKPVGLALGCAMLAFGAEAVIWQTSLAESGPGGAGWLGLVLPAAAAVALAWRLGGARLRESGEPIPGMPSPGVVGSLLAGVVAATAMIAWAVVHRRPVELPVILALESSSSRELRRDLAAYRKSPREAAIVRAENAEATTAWKRTDALIARAKALGSQDGDAVALWLAADAARFSPVSTAESRRKAVMEIEAYAKRVEGDAAWALETAGWLRIDLGEFDAAAANFVLSLRASPANAMAWYGLARAESKRSPGPGGRTGRAMGVACLLEPRFIGGRLCWDGPAVFSEAREFWERVRVPDNPAGLSASDFARVARHWAWVEKKSTEAGGRVVVDLANSAYPAAACSATAQVRVRLVEALTADDSDKGVALFASAMALLTDRHFNVGQAEALFKKCQGGANASQTPATREHILRSRPLMTGWRSSFTEGGVGSTLGEFEEDLLARLVCYGWESGPVRVDEGWLNSQISAFRDGR